VSTVHIYPPNDVVEHVLVGDDCPCGPDVEFLDGGNRLVTHHSLDGREHQEADHDASDCPACRYFATQKEK